MAAHVRTPVFDGPFDLLLQLVSEHKLDIYEIPLGEVVDAFVAELSGLEHMDLERCSEFLVIAAVLVELKSRALLPGPGEIEDDEELAGFDERDRLLARLYELAAYASAADAFALLIDGAARSVPRSAGLDEAFRDLAPDLLAGVTPEQLAAAYLLSVQTQAPPALDLSHVTVEAVTVSEAVAELCERLPEEGTVSFRELTGHCSTRMQVIVRFLALLELCKRGWVSLDQGTTFGDLVVTWTGAPAGDRAQDAEPGVEEYEG